MVDRQLVGVDAPIVPNDYAVRLNPDDFAAFESYLPGLSRQLETWLRDAIDRRGFTTLDDIRVTLTSDETVRRRAIEVDAANVDRPPVLTPEPEPVQPTEMFTVIRPNAHPNRLMLKFDDGVGAGMEFVIRKQTVTVGRSLENDLVLQAAEVSRRHARLDLNGGTLLLTDLDSTNGTKVNGRPITSRAIAVGDEISFGNATAVVAATSD
jgi:hypothetical protein